MATGIGGFCVWPGYGGGQVSGGRGWSCSNTKIVEDARSRVSEELAGTVAETVVPVPGGCLLTRRRS